jgi:hypothetical protein
MRRTAVQVGAILLVAAAGLFLVLTRSIREHKVGQKSERAVRDLLAAQAAIDSFARREGAPFEPAEDHSLPAAFSEHFARLRGDAPFHREQARIARLDVFARPRPYGEPLAYYVDGPWWVLASRGPDGVLDVTPDLLTATPDPAARLDALLRLSYDPTNGVESRGDLWVSNLE